MLKLLLANPMVLLALILALSGSVGGAIFWIDHRGFNRGYARHEAKVAAETRARQLDLFRVADRASEMARKLEAHKTQQTEIARRIEDEIRTDADVCRMPSDLSLQRLERRWGVAN